MQGLVFEGLIIVFITWSLAGLVVGALPCDANGLVLPQAYDHALQCAATRRYIIRQVDLASRNAGTAGLDMPAERVASASCCDADFWIRVCPLARDNQFGTTARPG